MTRERRRAPAGRRDRTFWGGPRSAVAAAWALLAALLLGGAAPLPLRPAEVGPTDPGESGLRPREYLLRDALSLAPGAEGRDRRAWPVGPAGASAQPVLKMPDRPRTSSTRATTRTTTSRTRLLALGTRLFDEASKSTSKTARSTPTVTRTSTSRSETRTSTSSSRTRTATRTSTSLSATRTGTQTSSSLTKTSSSRSATPSSTTRTSTSRTQTSSSRTASSTSRRQPSSSRTLSSTSRTPTSSSRTLSSTSRTRTSSSQTRSSTSRTQTSSSRTASSTSRTQTSSSRTLSSTSRTQTSSSRTLSSTSVTRTQTSSTTTRTATTTVPITQVTVLDSRCSYIPGDIPGFARTERYNIDLLVCGDRAEDGSFPYDGVFAEAARRWMSVVVGDVPTLTRTQPIEVEGHDGETWATVKAVDDLLVVCTVDDFDDDTLGEGGVWWTRPRFPFLSKVRLNAAHAQNLADQGLLQDVVMHEMGHALGFGMVWDRPALNLLSPPDCFDRASRGDSFSASFTGTRACAANNNMGLAGAPKVQSAAGEAGACAHWDEGTYGAELMTSYIAAGGSPLSLLTVASLEDMGYVVNRSSEWVTGNWRPSRLAMLGGGGSKATAKLGDCLAHARAEGINVVEG
ncbi:hypothetical protein DFJ74DRAFT_658605 [Hyaloraphidium curvatum]|nr:hypothetical protein DFJ74DRAFT_658605 [Hyaloraphidium curvatum]